MSNACTPILVVAATLVLKVLLLSNLAKFPYINIEGASLAKLEHVAIYINNCYTNKM